ncbi:YbaB/EbfC family nucleoid-associated protein [Patescibacteria group bacterium]
MFDKFKQLGELKKMRDQAVKIQKELAAEQMTVDEKNIKVTISGDQKIKYLEIDGEVQDRAVDVINKAVKESQKKAAKKLQQMGGGLSGLMKGMGQ